ncbi:hypothetical protein C7N43_16460 [Sphingobacteriales bacterium UPWRP_1]|nr:hypothetical protein B6N25_02450 [Sphingobacteriales bacterium TSM_CSS]PSJ75923.1 hypothetical protein C7N43_16460 [Sphingobacteriales bacterium UPWRP_1]
MVTGLRLIAEDPPVVNNTFLEECECNSSPGTADFMLTNADNAIYSGSGVTITYHESITDADNNLNALSSPYNSGNTTVYARVEDDISGLYSIAEVALMVFIGCSIDITSPCACMNNAATAVNGSDSDTAFSETITITGISGQTWTITAISGFYSDPAATTQINPGANFTETPAGSGLYVLSGYHIHDAGCTITASNGLVSFSADIECFYPNPSFTPLITQPVCPGAPAIATDNCALLVNITYSQNARTAFVLGATTVTVTATGSSGNTATCSFSITFSNSEPPNFTFARPQYL